jgi:dolichyldiphosphatase
VLKDLLQQPRPEATCAVLGNCHKHGMPSSHSAVMAFAATTCALLYLRRRWQAGSSTQGTNRKAAGETAANKKSRAGSSASWGASVALAVEVLELLAVMSLAAAVAYGRMYLGYHSAAQVAAGLLLGTTCALAWWQLTRAICERWGDGLVRLQPLCALGFRNVLGSSAASASRAVPHGGSNALHTD